MSELGLLAAVVVALIYAFADPLAGMVDLWNVSPMYSYGYSVPFVSAYLLWIRRDALARLVPQPSRVLGASVLVGAAILNVAGAAGGLQLLQQIAFIVALVGAVLWLLGVDYLKTAWASAAYLLLMIPLWDGLTEPLHWPFQNRSAEIGAFILSISGIPAYREGTYIALPGITLEVARACSGVNYLVAVIALGLPLSYVYLGGLWRRALLLGSAVLVAGLSNGLRVALIGILAHFEIGSPLHGPFHVLHGLFVAAVGYVVLFAGLRVLSPEWNDTGRAATANVAPETHADGPAWIIPRRELIAVLALFIALGAGVFAQDPQPVPLRTALDRLPAGIGRWHWDTMSEGALPAVDAWVGTDANLRRRYLSTTGIAVDVYVGYFAVQKQRKEIATYRSAPLHRRSQAHSVNGGTMPPFPVNLVAREDGKPETIFWYETHSGVETNPYGIRLRTLWNAVIHRRNNGMVVMLSIVPGRSRGDATLDDLQELAGLVRRELGHHLPNGLPQATQPS